MHRDGPGLDKLCVCACMCTCVCACVCMCTCTRRENSVGPLFLDGFLPVITSSSSPCPLCPLRILRTGLSAASPHPCSPHGLSSAPFPAVSLELCVRLLMAHFYDSPQPCQVCRELASCLTSPDEEGAPPLGSEPVPRAPPDTRHRPSPQ